MSLEHFIAIRCALKRRMLLSNNVVTAMIAGCWILASLFSIVHYIQPYRLMIEVSMDMSTHCCEYKSSFESFCEKWITILIDDTRKEDINQQIYATNFSITFALISAVFLTITLIYCYIIRVALQARKTKCHFQRYSISSNNKSHLARIRMRRAKGIGTTIFLLTSFIILWSPVLICKALILTKSPVLPSKEEDISRIDRCLIVVVRCTSVVDMVIYLIRTSDKETLVKKQGRIGCYRD